MTSENSDRGPVRVPTAQEIRQAADLLHIPLDADRMRLAQMTPGRQVTCLLAVVSTWLTAIQVAHDQLEDPLTADEQATLVSSATAAVAGNNASATGEVALWQVQWAGFVARAMAGPHRDNPLSPAGAVDALLRAATCLLADWRRTETRDGDTVDGVPYMTGDSVHRREAHAYALDALESIAVLLGSAAWDLPGL